MHGLEQAGEGALGVQVGRGGETYGAGGGGAQVREDVAKQVGGGHHVKTAGLQHETGCQDVDVLLVQRDLWVVLGDFVRALVPPGHADGDAVALGGQGDVLLGAALGQIKSELEQAVGAVARVDRFLDDDFAVGAFVHHAAERCVFALGVLAHHVVVDVARLATCQRAGHAFKQAYGAQVDVLIELAAELEQRTPQRNVVRHGGGPAHSAEEDGVHARQLRLPVVGHHLAVLGVIVAAGPFKGVQLQIQAKALGGGHGGAQAFGHDFFANAVSGKHGDLVGLGHGSP